MSINVLDLVENSATSEFYPTPPELVEKMIAGIDWKKVKTILEPSAGKGDILRVIATHENSYYGIRFDVDCIEIDANLRQILKYNFSSERKDPLRQTCSELSRKKYNGALSSEENCRYESAEREKDTFFDDGIKIVHDNFLTYDTCKRYDLIILNPPFSEGWKHLLKALEIIENGGTVICLLNAQTLKNPHIFSQRLLRDKLEKLGAEIEYIEGAFAAAERRTDAEIALVKVEIKRKQERSDIYDRLCEAEKVEEFSEREDTELAIGDYIKAAISMYKVEVKAGLELIRQYKALVPYILHSFDKDCSYNEPTIKLSLGRSDTCLTISENKYVESVRYKYWSALLNNPKFIGKLTSTLQNEYREKVNTLKNYEFSEYNITTLAAEMNTFIKSGIEEEAIKMFDTLTIAHTWLPEMLNNVHYYNGWSTNKACKIEKKVILPCHGVFSSWSDSIRVHGAREALEDLERVLNYFDGGMSRDVDSWNEVSRSFNNGITKNIEMKFFKATFYKKGTVHVTFTCPELIERFNIFAARNKNELPPSYGKKKYSEMTPGEKAVIDDFQGEKAYAEVLKRADFYLAPIAGHNPLMLESSEQLLADAT